MSTTPRRIALRSETASIARPAEVVEVSRALLSGARAGEPEVVRLFRVSECVAFGPKDVRAPGYAHALECARDAGFEAVPRVEGGRAIAAGPSTLGIAWTIPGGDGRARIRPRFSMLASIVADALRALGIDAEVGPVAGEYCPGDFSVGVAGRVKLAGLGQRVTAAGVHLGAFVVVDDADRLREVLTSVNAALEIPWVPASLGSVAELASGVTVEDVARAVTASFRARSGLDVHAEHKQEHAQDHAQDHARTGREAVPGGHR